MKKMAFILLFCLCSICLANNQDLTFHQPNLGNTELYSNEIYKDLKVELKMEHSYEKDNIFIFPCNYYGESEYYTLGFYVDMDKNIANEDAASNYRILYKNYYSNRCYSNVPEPCTFILFSIGSLSLLRKKLSFPRSF